jgi:hypothetical protein
MAHPDGFGERPPCDALSNHCILEPVISTLLTLSPSDLVHTRVVRGQTNRARTWNTLDARPADPRADRRGPIQLLVLRT